MFRKSLLLLAVITVSLMFASCDSGKDKYSTEQFKKFVEKSKKNGKMDPEKTKKAYKGIFPNMKMK